MTYPALHDRRIEWDIDGTILAWGGGYTSGITGFVGSGPMAELNDYDFTNPGNPINQMGLSTYRTLWWFFPEMVNITHAYFWFTLGSDNDFQLWGSSNSGNGLDGDWVTPTYPDGTIWWNYGSATQWRTAVRAVSFGQAINVLRMQFVVDVSGAIGHSAMALYAAHLYGQKDTGQTPDDILFMDSAGTGNEWMPDPDWGDVPYLSNMTKQFKLKNTSSSKVANTIALECIDDDFSISDNGVTYGSSLSLASLAANTQSSTYYVKSNPAYQSLPGPRSARIKVTVGSWT